MRSKTLGSIFILAGTTIGAGLLALPLSSAGLGFLPSLVLLLISYCLTALSSLVIVETLAALPDERNLHFDSMCRATLGKPGEALFLVAYVTLMYSITAAYLAGGSAIFQLLLQKAGVQASEFTCTALFTLILAGLVCTGARNVDFVNRYIMSAKGIIFVLILYFFIPGTHIPYLLDTKGNLPYVFIAIPILFLVFGYQLVIPSLYIYLERDIVEMRKTIYFGSAISLMVFILWLLVSMGQVPRFGNPSFASFLASHSTSDIAHFFNMTGQMQRHPLSRDLLSLFSNLALVTSFLGITLSLKDYLSDTSFIRRSGKAFLLSPILTFLPPFLMVTYHPALFQTALNYASSMLVVVLLWLPCAMVYVIRKKTLAGEYTSPYTTPGGNSTLILLTLSGGLIFVLGLMATANRLPVFGQ